MDVREKLVDLKPCQFCGGEARHYFPNANGMHLSNVGGVSNEHLFLLSQEP